MGNGDHASPASAAAARDAKKKRGNRTAAKLKQSKLETRRGQWLSHGQGKDKEGKEPKVAASPKGAGSGSPILASPHPPLPRRRADPRSKGSDTEDREEAAATVLDVGISDIDSPVHSPGSDKSRGGELSQRKGLSGNAGGGSSGSSVWSSSRSGSDAEDDNGCPGDEDEGEVLDDWEDAADTIYVDDNSHCHHQSSGPTIPPPAPTTATPATAARPEPTRSKTRAWAPDDVFRPSSLPSISKQASFPASIGNCWVGMGISAAQQDISLPPTCPICYEHLDRTDSSFLPCPCGFRVCLFCHKRILEQPDGGRCPGCRKQYNTASAVESGDAKAKRLSRSCSMGPRY